MIINEELLKKFNACEEELPEFVRRFPGGVDVSALWGTREERDAEWRHLLSDEFLRRQIGWAILIGILPARIDADLRDADLSRADLSHADLSHANLRHANLTDADLCRTNLTDADLRDACLRDACLRDADLHRSDLSHADLRAADLSNTNLRRADLRAADLSDADLRVANLRAARYCRHTIFPDGFDPQAHNMLLIED